MKNTLITATFLLASSGAFAGMKTFQPENASNPSFEDHVCIAAAAQGLDVAKDMLREAGHSTRVASQNLLCNDVSLKQFAEMYQVTAPTVKISGSIVLKPHNDEESRFCKDAAVNGVKNAVFKYGRSFKNITCNGLSVSSFVAKFKGTVIR
jgi:hypothetical protein